MTLNHPLGFGSMHRGCLSGRRVVEGSLKDKPALSALLSSPKAVRQLGRVTRKTVLFSKCEGLIMCSVLRCIFLLWFFG